MNNEDIILPLEYIEKLQQQNKKLHNKIEKAINYIKEEIDKNNELCLFEDETDELLEILKGDVDEN